MTVDTPSRPHPIAYTVKDAAVAVGLSVRYLRTQIQLGYLIARYAGSKPLITHAELVHWLSRLPTEPPQ